MRRFVFAVLAAMMALALVAPVMASPSVDAGLRERGFRPCYTAPNQRDALVAHARYVLDHYEVVAPEDVGSSALTRDIVKANYFGTLDCFVSRLDNAIRNEVQHHQPLEDADAAIDWFHALVALRT